ncbi:hypothetical protein CfE428DRAFT_1746 [Chthoniobacter flavus Ellin428]|uniref:Uncharacterized protein n=1 Tax=Chthoniobacter flavus Ellin428 TaxID=497964 RepID=B4CYK8_9BACT|nr:hypothetical protein CfE428DRAFT_1746 [Chthoniobacter flavus Ellin428]TCO89938.1 hypothetical protein EV701_112113 [Chthoniobacter flavus]
MSATRETLRISRRGFHRAWMRGSRTRWFGRSMASISQTTSCRATAPGCAFVRTKIRPTKIGNAFCALTPRRWWRLKSRGSGWQRRRPCGFTSLLRNLSPPRIGTRDTLSRPYRSHPLRAAGSSVRWRNWRHEARNCEECGICERWRRTSRDPHSRSPVSACAMQPRCRSIAAIRHALLFKMEESSITHPGSGFQKQVDYCHPSPL